jgi:hypothetical protein
MAHSVHGSGPDAGRHGSDQRWMKSRVLGEKIYSDAEAEVLKACDAYRRKHDRKFLDLTEVMSIMLDLGYHL